MAVPILKEGDHLIASVQSAMTDSDALQLQDDLMEQVGRYRAWGSSSTSRCSTSWIRSRPARSAPSPT